MAKEHTRRPSLGGEDAVGWGRPRLKDKLSRVALLDVTPGSPPATLRPKQGTQRHPKGRGRGHLEARYLPL
jgi:hypothetical protein